MVEPPAPTRVAIEFLTLWMEPGDEARRHAVEHITRIALGPDGIGPVLAGLLNLNTMTLFRLAQTEGAEDIAESAGDILREWSRQLPD
jgi:hypothetical protein